MKITYGRGDYVPGWWWFEVRHSGRTNGTFCQNPNPFKLLRAFVYVWRSTRRYERTGWYTKGRGR